MSGEDACDVANGFCGAFQDGRCFHFTTDRLWLEEDLKKRIEGCSHRMTVNNAKDFFTLFLGKP